MVTAGHHAMRKGRRSLPNQVYHLTVTTAGRAPLFADPRAAHAAGRRFDDARLLADATMLAWVLMPDHAHWLLQLGEAKPLQKVVESLKATTGREVNRALDRSGAVWARAFHDRALRREDDLRTLARYLIANPLRGGLVRRIGDYPYWNAVYL